MNKKLSEAKIRRKSQKKFDSSFLFIVLSLVFFWLTYAIYTASDCGFGGSKLAFVIIPLCMGVGNKATAILPFAIGCLSLWLAWKTNVEQ